MITVATPEMRKLLTLCGVLIAAALSDAHADQSTPPNIVLILADDLGWNDVGYHGSEVATPNMDLLANEGVTLKRFYVQPTCSPTRASLMTGQAAIKLGVVQPMSKINPAGLPLEYPLLPQLLKEKDYQTALVGKWHLGYRQQAYGPRARGFDHFYGHLTGGIGYWDHVHGGGLDWQRNGKTRREEGYSTHLLADEAIRVIKSRERSKPLFLYASFNAPHLPNEAPVESVEQYAHLPDPRRRIHAAMVTELDTAIGRIVTSLEKEGMLDNTLIWFMSDNGGLNPSSYSDNTVAIAETIDDWFAPGEAPLTVLEFLRVNVLEGAADNTPLRKGKQSIYEGGVRVPSFVYWRGELTPVELSSMMTVEDVTPTLLAIAQTPHTEDRFDGRNRWNDLQSAPTEPPTEESVYIVKSTDGEAIYQYPWKLLRLSSGHIELYDVETDPTESTDLTQKHPEKALALQQKLDATERGESIHVPIYRAVFNMDFFGGEEIYSPWAEQVEP